jgi:internalin A
MSNIYQNHSGSGDNVGGDKNISNVYNSQNLAQAAKDIKELLDQLSQEYSSTAMVGAKAIEEVERNPTLKSRIINALKEGGTTALEKLVDHPAVSIVVAAVKGAMQG